MSDVVTCYNDHSFYKIYNTREKIYKNGLRKLQKTSYDVVLGRAGNNTKNGNSTIEELKKYQKRHLKEKREKILDLALNNDHWEYFVTLTFSDEELGGKYSHDVALELLRKWIDNQKHQNRNMSYLLVAEFQKSGRLHFHGLFSNVPKWQFEKAINAKTGDYLVINDKQIYNLTNYTLGFTQISEIESQEKVSCYISKYISKELINLKFKKAFWYSRDLEKPKKDYHYFDKDLKEVYQDKNILYNNKVERTDCNVELLNYTTSHNIYYRKLNIFQ